ncbi:MAG: YceI family protein [Acidimicrobiales bacterium]|nr:YceI family protein [Acidimicrobiales bacterium]
MSEVTSSATRAVDTLELPLAGTYVFDPTHSSIEFSVRHMMVARVRGRFATFTGTITIGEDPADSSVEVVIDAASIDTGNPDRDAHLRSADFLDVEHFPELTYRSTHVRYDPASEFWEAGGLLTIRGISRPVHLEVEPLGAVFDLARALRAGFHAEASFDRYDFGLTWNQALPGAGVLVGRRVDIHLDVEAVRQDD